MSNKRIAAFLAAISILAAVIFTPVWHIELQGSQYPDSLYIWANVDRGQTANAETRIEWDVLKMPSDISTATPLHWDEIRSETDIFVSDYGLELLSGSSVKRSADLTSIGGKLYWHQKIRNGRNGYDGLEFSILEHTRLAYRYSLFDVAIAVLMSQDMIPAERIRSISLR